MSKIPQLFSWFNKKIKTKDDYQFMVITIFILFIIFTKCYMLVADPVKQKPTVNAILPQIEDGLHSIRSFITR